MSVFWIIAIVMYSVISIYFGLKPTRGGILDRLNNSIKNKKGKVSILALLRYVGTLILLFCGLFFFLPAGLIGTIKQKYDSWKIDKEIKERERTGYLYHEYLGGMGLLTCKVCGHKEEIVSFLHGPPIKQNGWSRTGYQCQYCFNHVTILEDKDKNPSHVCDCGGQLDRENPLKCSKCKSLNLDYNMTLIT
jgi:hypothetical protein